MKRDALWLGDRREAELMREIARIYTGALKTALEKQQRFFQKIEDIESGKYKPPQYYVRRGTVKKWRQGFVREALRQEQVIQGIMNVLNKAGKEASALMTPYLVDIYRYNRQETVDIVTAAAQKMGVVPNFAMYDVRKIRILLEGGQSPFSQIAYKNMGKNLSVRRRLQNEMAQAVILGESPDKIRRRVQKVTGQMMWQARRVAQTERTRVQGQAKWEAGQEAADMGIGIYNEWIARMVNTRETHAEMNGQKRMQGEPFQSPSGAELLYPGDPSAPPAEVINCFCQLRTRVLLPGERLVDGKVVKGLPDGGDGGRIEAGRQMSNGLRSMPRYLNDEEIAEVYKEIDAIKADRSVFDFRLSHVTAYHDVVDKVSVGGNVYPDLNSTMARDRMSIRATLAHEYYGHRKFRNTQVQYGAWNDEFRASYYASLESPGLDEMDRMLLMQDALEAC